MYDETTSRRQLFVANSKPMLLTDSSQSAPSKATETAERPLWLVDSSQPVAKAIFDTGNKRLLPVESTVASQRPLSLTNSSQSTPDRILEHRQKPALPIELSRSAGQDDGSGSPTLDARRSFRIVSDQSVATLYHGFFGTVTIHRKSKYVGSSPKTRRVDVKSMSEEKAILLRPAFSKYHYELRSKNSLGSFSRTLTVDRVVKNGDPIFRMCRSGDILGLIGAFSGGRASPDMVNQGGMGLLHVRDPPATITSLRLLTNFSMLQETIN